MSLPSVKFEKFFNEKFIISTGMANLSFTIETACALVGSIVISYQAWGALGFPIVIPGTTVDLSILAPILISVFPFLSFKLFTARRSAFDIIEDNKSFFVPTVVHSKTDDLVPPYTEE
jgi:hypothetical protein